MHQIARTPKSISLILVLLASVLVAFGVTAPAFAEDATFKRIAGKTCFDTAVEASVEGFESADTVVIATWDGYWDALAASPLAGANDAPILFTWQDKLASQTVDQIKQLGATKAFVVGGTAVVSDDVIAELEALNLEVERFAGATAIETADSIAAQVKSQTDASTCIIATSDGFRDALSVAPLAYAKGYPIYLVDMFSHDLAKSTKQAIGTNYDRAIIVGGNAAVSDNVENWLNEHTNKVERIGGIHAWQTSSLIADFCIETEGMDAAHIGIADGNGYWDALSGAPLCGAKNSPLVLVPHDGTTVDEYTFTYDDFCIKNTIEKHAADIVQGYIFGGISVVPENVETTVAEILKKVIRVYTVAYSDGLNGQAFESQTYNVKENESTPAFEGSPVRAGYTFTGWDPSIAETVTGDVVYVAQWEEIVIPVTYTVTYTDGVEDEVVFEDQVFEGLSEGSDTPAFDGEPVREGYDFTSWEPSVAETVTGNVVYVAQWKEQTEGHDYEGHIYGVKIPRGPEVECIKTYENAGIVADSYNDPYAADEHQSVFAHTDCLGYFDEWESSFAVAPMNEDATVEDAYGEPKPVDVFVRTPVLYYKYSEDVDSDGLYDELLISDTQNEGFEEIPATVYTDENGESCMMFAKYPASVRLAGMYESPFIGSRPDAVITGPSDNMSSWSWDGFNAVADGMATDIMSGAETPFAMKTPVDDWYVKAMFLMKYATKDSQSVFKGNLDSSNIPLTGTLKNRYADGCDNPQSGKEPFLIQGIELGHGVGEMFGPKVQKSGWYRPDEIVNNENRFYALATVNLFDGDKFTVDSCQISEEDNFIAVGLGTADDGDSAGLFYLGNMTPDEQNNLVTTRLSVNG